MGHSPRFGFSRLLLGFRRWPFVGTRGRWGTLLLIVGIFSAAHAQTQPPPAKKEVQFSTVAIPASLPPDVATTSQGNLPPGPGLTIIPTFDASIDAASQTVIHMRSPITSIRLLATLQFTFTTTIWIQVSDRVPSLSLTSLTLHTARRWEPMQQVPMMQPPLITQPPALTILSMPMRTSA